MSCRIEGLGTAVPPYRIDQEQAARLAQSLSGEADGRMAALAAVYRRSGVACRHSVLLKPSAEGLSGQTFYSPHGDAQNAGPTTSQRMSIYEAEAGPLALRASRSALDDAGIAPGQITHLITVSCTGLSAPSFDVSLLQGLGLASSVSRTHIGFMGCHGVMNGLRVARCYTHSDPEACVLVSAVELCSLHHQYGSDPEHVVANALFADGAGSLVVSGSAVGSAGSGQRPEILASGSTIFPESSDLMTWRIGDHGFEMRLSPKVPEVLRHWLRPWVNGWLRSFGLDVGGVGAWAVHPGGPRILSACEEALGLGHDALAPSRGVLEEFGNMSSPTVLFVLERLRRAKAPLPWVALGFGPGLAIEAMLVGPILS